MASIERKKIMKNVWPRTDENLSKAESGHLPIDHRLPLLQVQGNGVRFLKQVPMTHSRQAGPHVLVVDDSPDLQEVMASLLESYGYVVTVVDEPMRALDAVSRSRPDVCIVDIVLPGMDGYDLAERLRMLAPGLKIIAMSGYGRETARESECHLTLDAFLQKPFPTDALIDALDKCAPRARSLPVAEAPS